MQRPHYLGEIGNSNSIASRMFAKRVCGRKTFVTVTCVCGCVWGVCVRSCLNGMQVSLGLCGLLDLVWLLVVSAGWKSWRVSLSPSLLLSLSPSVSLPLSLCLSLSLSLSVSLPLSVSLSQGECVLSNILRGSSGH